MAELMFIVCSDVVPEIPTEDLTSVEEDDMTVADAEQSVDKFVKGNKKRKSLGHEEHCDDHSDVDNGVNKNSLLAGKPAKTHQKRKWSEQKLRTMFSFLGKISQTHPGS